MRFAMLATGVVQIAEEDRPRPPFAGLDAGGGAVPRSTRCTHSVQASTLPLPRGAWGFWSLVSS